jgi:hypothetical protein
MTVEQVSDATGLSLSVLRLMHSQGSFCCDWEGLYRAVDVERLMERRSRRR